jgi:hypothetical protein
MKVYELINALSECPAGAEVEFHTAMTVEDFTKSGVVDDFGGKDVYSISGTIKEVFIADDGLIVLYR